MRLKSRDLLASGGLTDVGVSRGGGEAAPFDNPDEKANGVDTIHDKAHKVQIRIYKSLRSGLLVQLRLNHMGGRRKHFRLNKETLT